MINGAILSNPFDCGSFIECRNRMVVNQQCESGKLFDLTLLYCIPSFAVDCGSRKDNSITEMTPPRSPIAGNLPQTPNQPQRPLPGPQRPSSPSQNAQDNVI